MVIRRGLTHNEVPLAVEKKEVSKEVLFSTHQQNIKMGFLRNQIANQNVFNQVEQRKHLSLSGQAPARRAA